MSLAIGYLISLVIWALLVFGSLKGALYLYREKVISEKWLLLVPYLFASLVFFGLRYRFSLWFMDRQAAHELFGIGAFWELDRIVLVVCLPVFYIISIMRPDWVARTMVNVPLLVFFPFLLRLALFLAGVVSWEQHPAQVMPTRLE